jgi:predicted RNase H-like HicB family nuclease
VGETHFRKVYAKMDKKDVYIYPAIFDYSDEGIAIEFPDLEGCFSCADTDEEALYMAKDALRGHLLTREDIGEDLPTPTKLKNIRTNENQKVVLIETCLAFYREASQSRAVKKTLTIPYWLNELAEKENINFSYALQNALKEQLHQTDS